MFYIYFFFDFSQGTRLINSEKNVGISKFAFNRGQVMFLPTLYKPPEGTYGKTIQTWAN